MYTDAQILRKYKALKSGTFNRRVLDEAVDILHQLQIGSISKEVAYLSERTNDLPDIWGYVQRSYENKQYESSHAGNVSAFQRAVNDVMSITQTVVPVLRKFSGQVDNLRRQSDKQTQQLLDYLGSYFTRALKAIVLLRKQLRDYIRDIDKQIRMGASPRVFANRAVDTLENADALLNRASTLALRLQRQAR
jgi:hypothetical protein